jgi:hypothetical protein
LNIFNDHIIITLYKKIKKYMADTEISDREERSCRNHIPRLAAAASSAGFAPGFTRKAAQNVRGAAEKALRADTPRVHAKPAVPISINWKYAPCASSFPAAGSVTGIRSGGIRL